MNFVKKIVIFKLKVIAKTVLSKHKPRIIGVTGSLGKTSAKEAIKTVLENDFKVYASSLNTEFGLPLAIIRKQAPKNPRNVFAWFSLIFGGLGQVITKNYPEILVLEMGVDKPGDMDYLLSIAKPEVAVITGIAPVHLELFGNIDKVFEEKVKIVQGTSKAVLNIDFPMLENFAKDLENEKITYSLKKGDITVSNVENTLEGLSFDLQYAGKNYPIQTQLFGEHSIYAILAGFAVASFFGLKPEKIAKSLKGYKGEKGRMNLLPGIFSSTIIDDSYNASPEAVLKALEAVGKYKGKRRIITVLGNMNELGEATEKAHREVGKKAGKTADVLVTIGENARNFLAGEALNSGMPDSNIHSFDNPFAAGEFLKSIITEGDIVLVKGSQNKVFSEEAVKYVLADGLDPKEVLVRQSDWWLKKKEKLRG